MAKASFIFVTAPPGRLSPLHAGDAVEPGGGMAYARPGKIRRIPYRRPDGSTSQTVRRAVNRGDLVLCDMNGALVDSFDAADAPDEIEGGSRDMTPEQIDALDKQLTKKGGAS